MLEESGHGDAGGSEVLPEWPPDRVCRGGIAVQRGQLKVEERLKLKVLEVLNVLEVL